MTAPFARPWVSAALTLLALTSAPAAFAQTAPAAPGASAGAAYKVVDASFACQKVTCDAEMWLPTQTPAGQKPPVILIAHGFGGLKDWGLPAFAERFVQAGFAVVRFDYRGFGKSGGQPRRVVDGKAHVQDWLSAIDAISKRPEVDGQRLGIWGTSYSGGQVLVAGAERPNVVKAVSAQVPFVSGLSSGLKYPIKYQPMATWYAMRDLLRSDDEEPLYVPVVSDDGGFAALICDECASGYKKLVPEAVHKAQTDNRVAARVFLSLPFWFPGNRAKDIVAPTLIIAAENDGLIPVSKVRDVAKSLQKGEYLELKGADHFSPYTGPAFEQTVARQTAFFKQHLMR